FADPCAGTATHGGAGRVGIAFPDAATGTRHSRSRMPPPRGISSMPMTLSSISWRSDGRNPRLRRYTHAIAGDRRSNWAVSLMSRRQETSNETARHPHDSRAGDDGEVRHRDPPRHEIGRAHV